MNITGTQVKESMIGNNIPFVAVHKCSICDFQCGYQRDGEKLFYNSGCDCIVGRPYNLQPRDWQDAADWVNMQRDPKWKVEYASRFGIKLEGQ